MTSSSSPDTDQDRADPRDQVFDVTGVTKGLGSRTGRSAITVLLFAAAKIIVALGSTAVLARLVPPEQQAVIAMAMPAILIATGLSEFGLAQAVVQRPHVTHQLASTLLWTNVALGATLSIAVALLGGPAAVFYDVPEAAQVFVWMSPYIFLSVLTAQYVAILRRQMRIRQIEIGGFGAACLAAVMAIGAALAGAGYWALVIQLVMTEVLNLLYLLVLIRWLPSSPLKYKFQEARSALSFGGYLAAERLLGEFARSIQLVVIGRLFAPTDAALFYRAQTIAQMPQRRIISPLSGAFIPSLSRLQDDRAEFQSMYMRQVTRANLVMVPIGLLVCSCADVLVRILLGPDWTGVVPLLAWLGLLPMTALTLSSFLWTLVACGCSKQLFLARLAGTGLLLAALFTGAQFGVVGLVAGYMLALVFGMVPLMAVVSLRYTPLTLDTVRRTFLGEAVFAAGSLALLLGLRDWLQLETMFFELLITGAVLAALVGLRLAFNVEMRRDVMKALKVPTMRK